jgi:hypothetical protein
VTVKQLPHYTLSVTQPEIYVVSTADQNFRKWLLYILEKINGYHPSFIIDRLWSETGNEICLIPNPKSSLAIPYMYVGITLAKYYDSKALLAWQEGLDSFVAKLKSVSVDSLNSGFAPIDRLVKYLVGLHFAIFTLPYDVDSLKQRLSSAQERLSIFIQDNAKWPNKWLKKDSLDLAIRYSDQIGQAQDIIVGNGLLIKQQTKLLTVFSNSRTIFNFDFPEISSAQANMARISTEVRCLTQNSLPFAESIELVSRRH